MRQSVDNFKLFREHLDFSHPESFYFLQIIQRSKDDNEVTSSNNRYRRVKSYYISSVEEYDRFIPKIKKFCENNNARAYIRVNPVSFYDVAIATSLEYMRRIQAKQTFKSCNIYDSCCESVKTVGEKLWIVDIDENLYETFKEVDKLTEVQYVLPTVSGIHVMIKPFDSRNFNVEGADLKKNNPITLLYYNNDLSGKLKQKIDCSR